MLPLLCLCLLVCAAPVRWLHNSWWKQEDHDRNGADPLCSCRPRDTCSSLVLFCASAVALIHSLERKSTRVAVVLVTLTKLTCGAFLQSIRSPSSRRARFCSRRCSPPLLSLEALLCFTRKPLALDRRAFILLLFLFVLMCVCNSLALPTVLKLCVCVFVCGLYAVLCVCSLRCVLLPFVFQFLQLLAVNSQFSQPGVVLCNSSGGAHHRCLATVPLLVVQCGAELRSGFQNQNQDFCQIRQNH
jgi:hypothetical protein